jgi:hypothetical protein
VHAGNPILDAVNAQAALRPGSPEATRRAVNKAFLQDMRKAWDKLGMKALEKCAKNQPAAFCKMYVLLVPREMKVEHSPRVSSLTDEQIVTAITAIRAMLDQREKALDAGQVIEGKAEPVALPAPTSKGEVPKLSCFEWLVRRGSMRYSLGKPLGLSRECSHRVKLTSSGATRALGDIGTAGRKKKSATSTYAGRAKALGITVPLLARADALWHYRRPASA